MKLPVAKVIVLLLSFTALASMAPMFAQGTNPYGDSNLGTITTGTQGTTGTAATSGAATGLTQVTRTVTAWVRNDLAKVDGKVVVIARDSVNLRSGPGTNFEIIQAANAGARFTLQGEQNGWYKIAIVTTEPAPVSEPKSVDEAQANFLQAYKKYTESTLANGRSHPTSQAALKGFRSTYATYKQFTRESKALADIRAKRRQVDKVVVSKASFTATVYSNGEVVRVFPIAYGSNPDGLNKQKQGDCRTPEGSFQIVGKAVNPPYRGIPGQVIPGGAPNNPFGTRFMALNTWGGSIGMHGTSNPNSIGSRASHGCMRMFTEDAEELYDLVKVGTPVIIKPVKEG